MVHKLSGYLAPSVEGWDSLKYLLSIYIPPAEMANIKNIFHVFDSLMVKRVIRYGDYKIVKEMLTTMEHKLCCEIVEEYEHRINQGMQEGKTVIFFPLYFRKILCSLYILTF